jgi:hypothetical protein
MCRCTSVVLFILVRRHLWGRQHVRRKEKVRKQICGRQARAPMVGESVRMHVVVNTEENEWVVEKSSRLGQNSLNKVIAWVNRERPEEITDCV